jgi:hypothetical protein
MADPAQAVGARDDFGRGRRAGNITPASGVGGMTGILLTGVFATASIGGTSGLIEGNPKQLLTQLYGVMVTLAWSGGVTFVLFELVSVFLPLRVTREHEVGGLDISQHGKGPAVSFPILIPFCCPSREQDYVGSLSCLCFRHVRLYFRRDRIAQVGSTRAKAKKVRFHSPLGNARHLARHLILWGLAVPA